jgi:hypothetical protein
MKSSAKSRWDLELAIASDDASDKYQFGLEQTKDKLIVTWSLAGTRSTGTHALKADVLDRSGAVFWVDQGAVMSVSNRGKVRSHRATDAAVGLPVFVLARDAYQTAVAGKPTYVHSVWGEGEKSESVTACTASLVVKGKKQKVPALEITAGGVTLKVLRSRALPLVLMREEGDNGIEIVSVSVLPELDDTEVAAPAAKKKPAASGKPTSAVETLLAQLSHKDPTISRAASRALHPLLVAEDHSGMIVDTIEREKLMTLPPWARGIKPAALAKLQRREQLLVQLGYRPGIRGEAFLRTVAADHPDAEVRRSAASKLIEAMRDDNAPKDEARLGQHARQIHAPDREGWSNAVFAAEALGAEAVFRLFSPLLTPALLATAEGLDRAKSVFSALGDGANMDPRWKKVLKPLRANADIGHRAKEALGEST